MKAVKRFNPEFKVRLVSFAVHWIKAEMHEFILRNWRIVKVATTKSQRKLFFNLRSAKRRLGWMNSREVSHVAQALGVEPEVVRQMEGRLASHDEPFDAMGHDEDSSPSPASYLKDSREDPALVVEKSTKSLADHEKLVVAFKELDARAREIIQRRWLTDKKSTLHELADQFEISAERVRQLEKNALKKLKLSFEA
jgi:RNA polymerase sigma-32 factor